MERRYLRPSLLQIVLGLFQVKLCRQAHLKTPLGDVVGFLLCTEIRLGDRQPGLKRPHFHVVQGNFGKKADKYVPQILFAGLQLRFRRLDGTPNATEQIYLPTGIKASRVEVARLPPTGFFAATVPACRAGSANGGEAIGLADAPPGTRLANPRPSLLQIEVACHRGLDQARQDRIIECRPPICQRLCIHACGGQTALQLSGPLGRC